MKQLMQDPFKQKALFFLTMLLYFNIIVRNQKIIILNGSKILLSEPPQGFWVDAQVGLPTLLFFLIGFFGFFNLRFTVMIVKFIQFSKKWIVRMFLGFVESTYQIIISSKNNLLFLVSRDLTNRCVPSCTVALVKT